MRSVREAGDGKARGRRPTTISDEATRARGRSSSSRSHSARGRASRARRPGPPSPRRGRRRRRRRRAASRAAFLEVYKVLMHPRCMNCHPTGDVPLQGDDSHLHAQNVQRGPDGKGKYALEMRELPSTRQPARPEHAAGQPELAPAAARDEDGLPGQEPARARPPAEGPESERAQDAGANPPPRHRGQARPRRLGPRRRPDEAAALAR